MKNTFFAFAMGTIILSACNNSSNNKSAELNKLNDSSTRSSAQIVSPITSPVNGLLQIYLQMKNDFVNDDDKDAAIAGNEMLKVLNDFNRSLLKEEEKRNEFEDIADDAKENAEHIAMSAGNIKHQREHFDMLSKDMYDLVKNYTPGERIYVDYCPTYNDNKGVTWLSEIKEIKNPYLGGEMDTCGSIKEELK